MDTTKKIARAVLNKNFAEAKELVFKSLYARASLSLDEARYAVADAVFNSQPEQIDEISKATKDSYVAKRGSQLSSMMRGPEKNYPSLPGKKQANAVKGIKRAMGVKEEIETIDEASDKGLRTNLHHPKGKAVVSKSGKVIRVYKSDRAAVKHAMSGKTVREEVDQLDEVSPPGMEKMTGSKKVKAAFAKRYGKRGKEVMYATAWKQHNKKMAEETEQIDEVMTRKHFQQVADVIKSNPDAKKREELAAHHSQIFKKSNPRFDEKRFRKACGVGGCD